MSEESHLLPQTSQREASIPGFGVKVIGGVSVGLLGCGLVLAAYLNFGSVQQEVAPGRELYHVSHVSHVSYVDDEAGHSHHEVAVSVPTVHHVHVSHSHYYGSDGSDGYQTLQAHVDDAFRPYHCYQHLGSWWSTWSTAKKDYCCQRHSVFCGTHASPEPEAVYDDSTMEGMSEPVVHHVVHHVVHVGHHVGHWVHSATSATSDIPRCGHSDNNCPAAWKSKAPGGYHCLHKLARQTSDKAYKASGGACRPVKLGAFPSSDCHAQCYVGRARSLSGGSSHHFGGSSHSGSFGSSYQGGSYGGSHYHGGSYYHQGGSFQGAGSSALGDFDSDGDSSYTYHHSHHGIRPPYGGSYDDGYHGGSSYTVGGSYHDGDSSYHHGGYHGSSSYTVGGSYHHGGSSHYEHGGYHSYHHSGHSHTMGGHYKMRGSYSSHHVPPCAGADHRCPAEWLSGETGGFHCKHKLKRQTSEKTYLKSGGACRPAKEGRFPFNDCEAGLDSPASRAFPNLGFRGLGGLEFFRV